MPPLLPDPDNTMAIQFHAAPRKDFPNRSILRDLLKKTALAYGKKVADLNYAFVSDEELLEMNRQYLQHDYYTDIITFDQSDSEDILEGDIYISIDRVIDNGNQLGNGPKEEYCRVLAHGLLHLCGLGDKSEQEIKEMRAAEDRFIQAYQLLESQSGT